MSEHYKILRRIFLICALNERAKLTTFYSAGSLVLPGEVEQTVTSCTPFFDKPIQVKFRTSLVPQPSDSKAQEVRGQNCGFVVFFLNVLASSVISTRTERCRWSMWNCSELTNQIINFKIINEFLNALRIEINILTERYYFILHTATV